MLGSAEYGTAKALSGLPLKIGAKTGTAEIGSKQRTNSWSIGFFPYDKPRIAYAILMERGPEQNTIGATYVASQVINWIINNDFLTKLNNDILLVSN